MKGKRKEEIEISDLSLSEGLTDSSENLKMFIDLLQKNAWAHEVKHVFS